MTWHLGGIAPSPVNPPLGVVGTTIVVVDVNGTVSVSVSVSAPPISSQQSIGY